MPDTEKLTQRIRGHLVVDGLDRLDERLDVKVAILRDCFVLASQVLTLEPTQADSAGAKTAKKKKSANRSKDLQFDLQVETEGLQDLRVVAGPDVPDDRLLSADVSKVTVAASQFDGGSARGVEIAIPARRLLGWRFVCRKHVLRGRLVCREFGGGRGLYTDLPVRGAEVTAYDIDRFWWWYSRIPVGSAVTDENGYFEIEFTWCCLRPFFWLVDDWKISPDVLAKIRDLIERHPIPIPLPDPPPVPDPRFFDQLLRSASLTDARFAAASEPFGATATVANLEQLGQRLVTALPEAPDLRQLRVWPWFPLGDCRPDIVFEARQDCGGGEVVVYDEGISATRYNVPDVLSGIVLQANGEACCGPPDCIDLPTGECLALYGVGCGSSPSFTIDDIEQDASNALVGYGDPNGTDTPFGGSIPIRGTLGTGSTVDYYRPQRRRILPSMTGWQDVNADEIGSVTRQHWIGPPPPYLLAQTVRQQVAGQTVLETVKRFRDKNPQVSQTETPSGYDWLFRWNTAGLGDGVYELRFVGYEYDANADQLINPRILPICPAPGQAIDPAQEARIKLRLDNRVATNIPGSVHIQTSEPNCDFPDSCAVEVLPAVGAPYCVQACGFARLSAGDRVRIRFSATDSDGHLGGFNLTAHWGESNVFNVLSQELPAPGTTANTYAEALNDGAMRPTWHGGSYQVTVPATAFVTCCAYLLDLRVWKRTTDGCTAPWHFHTNRCQFSFTVIREDLVSDPNHPGCTELCDDDGPVLVAAESAG